MQPWLNDACSLVEEFRAKRRSPSEELQASFDAIEGSQLNAFSYLDFDRAIELAKTADVSLPFGGVPTGIKELDSVKGWPATKASLVFADKVAEHDDTHIQRAKAMGIIPVGLTTASEVGFVAYTSTLLNGTTRNPWDVTRTPGGSSGGSAAAVAGGLVCLATGGDGGGSIRIPSSYSGLFGLKATQGRIPRGPITEIELLTVNLGVLARSVRDVARWFDNANGYHPRDAYSLPQVSGWEHGLGKTDVTNLRVMISPDLGETAVIHPESSDLVTAAAEKLIALVKLRRVEADIRLPALGTNWAMGQLPMTAHTFADVYPEREEEIGFELRFGLSLQDRYRGKHQARLEVFRTSMIEAMADVFEKTDFVITCTTPSEAFAAEGPMPSRVGEQDVSPFNGGALTIPGNIAGIPGITIPIGLSSSGLPIGMQVYSDRHREQELLELGLAFEREWPWPLVAPTAPM